MRETAHCKIITGLSKARTNKPRHSVIEGSAFHYSIRPLHHTSFRLVLGISKVGPTHARSVLGGVRSGGSKNQVLCSITCDPGRWYIEQSPGRVSSLSGVWTGDSYVPFSKELYVVTCCVVIYSTWCYIEERNIYYCMLGQRFCEHY